MFIKNNQFVFDAQRIPGFDNIYPIDDIAVAMHHLAGYCCSQNLLPSQGSGYVCPRGGSKWFADSPYLYDHLIDIGMRRLSGSPQEQYPGAGLDQLARSRRSEIEALGSNPAGTPAGQIMNLYMTYRKPGEMIGGTSPMPLDYYRNHREKWGLTNRHRALCGLAARIADHLTDYGKGKMLPHTSLINQCLTMVSRFIANEYHFTQTIMANQAAKLMATNAKIYADVRFGQTKLQTLLDGFSRIQSTFALINQKVIMGTKMCSGG
ncbi:MAG: hypothetical protein NZL83_01360 [Candidatus Absconditabacterales bacterium]|nr:hypothetical protein [Candidatus Absconditabacterales bacterium]